MLRALKMLVLLLVLALLPGRDLGAAGSIDFVKALMEKTDASIGYGLRVAVLLRSGKDDGKSDAQLAQMFTGEGVFRDGWNVGDALDRGELSFILTKALPDRLKGGLWQMLFGVSERYAYRDLSERELVEGGGQGMNVSGPELISTMRRVSTYLKGK